MVRHQHVRRAKRFALCLPKPPRPAAKRQRTPAGGVSAASDHEGRIVVIAFFSERRLNYTGQFR